MRRLPAKLRTTPVANVPQFCGKNGSPTGWWPLTLAPPRRLFQWIFARSLAFLPDNELIRLARLMRSPILHLSFPFLLLLAGAFTAQSFSQNPDASPGQQQPQPAKENKDKGSLNDAEAFSTAVASNVLNDLRNGLEGHNPRRMLSAFDADKMEGYLEFQGQIQALFNRYESFRLYFHIAESDGEGAKGVALVDIQLEEIPRGATSPPVRKNAQMRFELERGRKGWKIVDLNPRNFFS